MILRSKLTNYIKVSILVILLLASTSPVSAAENSKNLKLDFKKVEEYVDTTISKDEEGLNINSYSEKYNENAYLYIYQYKNYNWASYDAIVLQVENKSNKPQRLNLQIENTSKNQFNLKEDAIFFLKNSETKYYSQGKMVYSTAEIPAKFKGKIYITFDNFINKESNDKISKKNLKNITSWGITIIPTSEGENIITLNKIKLLKKQALNTLEDLKDIKIIGSEEVQIPMVGESIESYKVKGKKNIKFTLLENYTGVNLSEDGKLTINDKAKAGEIIFRVNIKDKIKYEKSITLTHSWTFNQVDENGVPYGLLPPDKSPTVNSMSKFMFLENSMIFIRIFLVSVSFICLMLYIHWKRKRNKTA